MLLSATGACHKSHFFFLEWINLFGGEEAKRLLACFGVMLVRARPYSDGGGGGGSVEVSVDGVNADGSIGWPD